MKIHASLLAALVLISVPCSGLAQEAKVSKDPTAVQTLQWASLAMGGPQWAAIRDLQGIYAVRERERETYNSYQMTLKALGRSMWRTESLRPNGLVLSIFNGGRMKRIAGTGELEHCPSLSVAEAGNWLIPSLSVLGEWERPDIKVTYLGQESGAAVHHIRLEIVSEDPFLSEIYEPFDVLIDAQSYLPLKLSFSVHPPTNLLVDFPVEVVYGEYTNVNGVVIPSLITFIFRGQVLSEYRLTNFARNIGIPETEFDMR